MNARSARLNAAPPASMGRRFVAASLDVVAWLVAAGWLVVVGVVAWARAEPSTAASQDALRLVTIGMALTGGVVIAHWLLHGRYGWTLGRLAMGVRTLDVETREPVGPARIFVRTVVVLAGAAVLLVGAAVVLASPFLDRTRRNRGWHDRAAGDEVLDVRRSALALAERPPWRSPQRAAEPSTLTRGPAPLPEWAATLSPTAVRQPSAPPLLLSPVTPRRSSPDLDTRTMPVVRQGLAYGLTPELELTRPAAPRADLPAVPPPATDRPAAEFELSDGRHVSIERTALVGRNPASDAPVQLVRVADPTRSVSKTHLQIGVEPSGVWVADRGSTNGTVVNLPDGGQVVCGVDQQVRIRVGSTVVFGDCSMRLVRVPTTGPTA
ncbi:RDD family protein [Cellulomonas sp. URHE0023]|uniref:RDD family protein n=1 Tax=Cellulomonas sp. URHE0023 TaxID=1380354 RepID=UPI000ABC5664|nr:RDD family protein [Cellulomonas sp. URHE0023]